MEIIELTAAILGLPEDDGNGGIHRRLLAGLDSILGRATDPMIEAKERGGSGFDRGYDDFDWLLTIDPGLPTGRRVDGWFRFPVHVSCTGKTTWGGRYDSPDVNLIIWSADDSACTHFVGAIPYDVGDDEAAYRHELTVAQRACRTMLAIARRAALATAVLETAEGRLRMADGKIVHEFAPLTPAEVVG